MKNEQLLIYKKLNDIPEKIDTITIRLAGDCVDSVKMNSIYWNKVTKGFSEFYTCTVRKGLNLRRTVSDMQQFYYCDLQFEFIFYELLYKAYNQNSILNVVRTALMYLEFCGFLKAPNHFLVPNFIKERENKCPENLLKILCNYSKVASLVEIDFAFDYKKDEIRCFDDCIKYDSTRYSNEGRLKSGKKAKSRWICYDRIEKEKAKRQESFSILESMTYPQRLEVRLGSDCEYLNLENLRGNFYTVAFLFSPILAKSWKKNKIAQVPTDQKHIVFNYIQFLSNCMETPKLSEELKKKEKNKRKDKPNLEEPLII